MNRFEVKLNSAGCPKFLRLPLRVLQVNLGNVCNQACSHCHVSAGPDEDRFMSRTVVDQVLRFLALDKGLVLDLTGGAPELNPSFEYLFCRAADLAAEVQVRSNLTVLLQPDKQHLFAVFAEKRVHLICSLPCTTQSNVDQQRGSGAFQQSLDALRRLNEEGYGLRPELGIDLVYNPAGPFLPPPSGALEEEYRGRLREDHGIVFNRLLTMANAPVGRFKERLKARGEHEKYLQLLEANFNAEVVESVMCRTLLSVGWDGRCYDCDFNQAQGLGLEDDRGEDVMIKDVRPQDLTGRVIRLGEHCLCCTAGAGSSCQGALKTVSAEGGE